MQPDHPSDLEPRILELPGGPAAYVDEGEGPVIVLVHGLPGSARDFRWLAPCLAPSLRVIRLNLPGAPGTPVRTAPGSTLRARGDFVVAMADALGLDRFVVLGHSFGGGAAVAAAEALGERARGLALLAALGTRRHRSVRRSWPRLTWALLRTPVVGARLYPRMRQGFHRAGFRGVDDATMLHTMGVIARTSWAEHGARVRRLRVPTFVSWTEDDHFLEPEVCRELAEACPAGPRLAFPDGGHNLQKSRAIEIAEALVPWVVGLQP